MGDEDKQEQAEPYLVFATQEDYTAHIGGKAAEIVAPKNRKIEELTAQAQRAQELEAQLSELQQQVTGKEQTAAQKWEAEKATLLSQQKAAQAQIEEAKAHAQSLAEKRQSDYRERQVTKWALKNGAQPTSIDDMLLAFPSNHVQITDEDGKLSATMVDPTTGIQVDADKAMAGWLDSKPHFKGPPNSGSGSGGAGAKAPEAKTYEPTAEGFAAAMYGK